MNIENIPVHRQILYKKLCAICAVTYKQKQDLIYLLNSNKDLRSLVFAGSLPEFDQEIPADTFKHVDIERAVATAILEEVACLDIYHLKINNLLRTFEVHYSAAE